MLFQKLNEWGQILSDYFLELTTGILILILIYKLIIKKKI